MKTTLKQITMAKIINFSENKNLAVKNICIYESLFLGKRITKGVILLEANWRILINGAEYKLIYKDNSTTAEITETARKQIKRTIGIALKRYRTQGTFWNGADDVRYYRTSCSISLDKFRRRQPVFEFLKNNNYEKTA
jgi:hypothetical protein